MVVRKSVCNALRAVCFVLTVADAILGECGQWDKLNKKTEKTFFLLSAHSMHALEIFLQSIPAASWVIRK